MDERELIYDWNRVGEGGAAFDWSRVRVDLNDETLRDGLQSPSVRDPALDVKKRLLHLMADLGIVAADIGLPGGRPPGGGEGGGPGPGVRQNQPPPPPQLAPPPPSAPIQPVL